MVIKHLDKRDSNSESKMWEYFQTLMKYEGEVCDFFLVLYDMIVFRF